MCRNLLRRAGVALASLCAGACSLVVDFTECVEDKHCADAGLVCLAGSCAERPSDITVDADITEDTTWSTGTTYHLEGVIYVHPGVTLTVEPGVEVIGASDSALVVAAGGRLESRGTRERPVVFTSGQALGTRAPGDWGGLSLLGDAPVNADAPLLEGLDDPEFARYGGDDAASSCGVLQYTRIEFAGRALTKDKELNGLTLAGCGAGTIVDHVQVHAGLDDGLELFGGTVDLRHVVITNAGDDGLDWQLGWTGTGQFIAIAQGPEGDNGIEADNSEDDHAAAPRSAPTLYNVTILGLGSASERGVLLRHGTAGELANFLISGHGQEAVDIRDAATVNAIEDGALRLRASLFYAVGQGGEHYFPTLDDEAELDPGDGRDDDGGFDEDAFFRDEAVGNTFGSDPELAGGSDVRAPRWLPGSSERVTEAAINPPPNFDEGASYVGAFAPGDGEPWTVGWTDYAER